MSNSSNSTSSEIIEFPKLIDSSVSSGIVTLNEEFKNTKERKTKISLELYNNDNDNDNDINKIENLTCFCDYSNLVNISYKLKSTLNQIEESIKSLANK